MTTQVEALTSVERDLYVPRAARIIEKRDLTEHEAFFRLEMEDGRPLGHDSP